MKHQNPRKQPKIGKKRRSGRPGRNRQHVVPRTAQEFFVMPQHLQGIWTAVAHTVSKMRVDRASLHQAAAEFGATPRQVLRLGGAALRKLKNGRYVAKAFDQLLRVLVLPTMEGVREIAVIDSRQATLLAEYWNAVQRYLETGDDSALKKFRGKQITDANGHHFEMLTAPEELEPLASAGVLSFESIYARAA